MTVPLALASAGWTVIGAVGGALVGASAGGIVDWLLGLRKEAADAKAGARLVAGDIATADSQLAEVEQEGKWWGFYGHPIAGWERYRPVLAVKLSYEDWEAVEQAVVSLEGLRRSMPSSPKYAAEVEQCGFVSLDAQAMPPLRRHAAQGYNALSELGGHPKEGDLIKVDLTQPGTST
ncbi:MAG: hypothetical protein JST53_00900 [Actinobacteria bacterium]|nr:hypothetical protein [Actinomycetota bacterium]